MTNVPNNETPFFITERSMSLPPDAGTVRTVQRTGETSICYPVAGPPTGLARVFIATRDLWTMQEPTRGTGSRSGPSLHGGRTLPRRRRRRIRPVEARHRHASDRLDAHRCPSLHPAIDEPPARRLLDGFQDDFPAPYGFGHHGLAFRKRIPGFGERIFRKMSSNPQSAGGGAALGGQPPLPDRAASSDRRDPRGDDPVATASTAWTAIQLRELSIPNRVWLSPMCQYSADEFGAPTDWHIAHYGARAAGGVGMVVVECTGVAPDMRTTARDLGLYTEKQVTGHQRLAAAIRSIGSIPAVQLGVAGRKSSHGVPWDNAGTRNPVPPDEGGWQPLAPSPIAFAGLAVPTEMSTKDATRVLEDIERAARNAHRAGYEAIELHGANGYLLHEFLSPLANHRTDEWGGTLERRMRFPLQMIEALRASWPEDKPVLVRLPAEDLIEDGLTTDDMVAVATRMAAAGVDMIDLVSGALTPAARRLTEPLHNARYGPRFRAAGVPVAASGLVSEAHHLDEAVPELVDAVLVGRAMLRDPYWALRALDAEPRQTWPKQYHRAF
ncbi:hypothetical protein GCM10025787_00050 [Saccharopolyspora rosea]